VLNSGINLHKFTKTAAQMIMGAACTTRAWTAP